MNRRRFLKAGSGLLVPAWIAACSADNGSSSGAPPPGAKSGPRGLHVSWAGDPHSTRAITWFTDGVEAPEGVVEYGSDALDKTVVATQQRAFDSEVLTHRAALTDFDPEKPLRYRVRNGDALSREYALRPQPRGRFRFAHFGDHGRTEYARAVRNGILQRGSDFVMIAGDLSYANGEQAIWDDWFNQTEHLLAQIPAMCCPGNHEDKDGGGAAYRTRFTHPGTAETYYSFDYENVHFMVSTGGALIDDGTLPAELLKIETDLAQAALRRAAGEIDYIVFVQHFTIWTDEEGRSPMNPTLVLLEENIMLRYGVDLLVVGHDHGYQRSVPMGLGLPLPFGYTQVVGGGGGASMRTFSGQGAWSGAQQRRYSFIEYAVDGPTMKGTAYAVDDGEDGPPTDVLTVVDEFEVPARPGIARFDAVKPVRDLATLLADTRANWRYVEAHTKLRNARHLGQARWHV